MNGSRAGIRKERATDADEPLGRVFEAEKFDVACVSDHGQKLAVVVNESFDAENVSFVFGFDLD